MSKDIYDKFYSKLSLERMEIAKQMSRSGEKISNPEEKLQKLVFPEGMCMTGKMGDFELQK